MAKTLAQIALDIANQAGIEYYDLDNQETVDSWVREALDEILSQATWAQTYQETLNPTVALQREYALDLGTGDIVAIHKTDGTEREILLRPLQQLIDEGKDISITGEPQYWYPLGMSSDQKVAGLWPVPDAVYNYTIYATLDPALLTRLSTFPLPEDFIPALKNYVRKLTKESEKDYNGADRAAMAFASSMRRLHSKYQNVGSQKFQFKFTDLAHRQVINHLRIPDTIG
jgi:hypothetical protein